jgi:hypothetical protein
MDIFGNTVNLQLETVILFFLIGIVIVLLLFCFEPWKLMTTAKASTPTSPTQQPTAEKSPTTTVEPFQQVTPDARILYKKVGFSKLGSDGKDARVNILKFKTRPIKNSETDFQVTYMFTKDIETLMLLNKGESIKLMDSSTTTTTQPAGTNTLVKPIYNSFTADMMAQSVYPTLKRTLCAQLGLPEDYVTYSMGLADKVLADYMARAGSTADTKLLAAQDLVKAEFAKLPASGGTEWQTRLRVGITKITGATGLYSLPLPLDGLLTSYESIVPKTDTYWSSNNNNAQIRASILYVIESIINTNPLIPNFPNTGTLFKYMYVYDMITPKIADSATALHTKIKANPTKLLTKGELDVSQGTFQGALSNIPYIENVFTPRVGDNTITETELDVIGNAIYDTFSVFLYGQFVNTEDITTTTTKPAETPQLSNDEIQILQAIGSKYYDPATGDRKVRDGDFYLEFGNGLDVNIKFLFNYVTNMTGEVKCEATIIELPSGSAADPNYKTYTFDNCLLEYIGGKMVVTLEKRTGPLNYAKAAEGKYNVVTVIQTFKLEINIDGAISLENDTFQSIIQRAVFFNTFMTYSLSAQLEPGVVKPIYSINLYPQSITSSFESLKEYTKAALGKTTERLLKDNVAEIVTPMFMVDQRLDRTEGVLTKIMDHYRFNELSNAQSGYRFYPVSE